MILSLTVLSIGRGSSSAAGHDPEPFLCNGSVKHSHREGLAGVWLRQNPYGVVTVCIFVAEMVVEI